ncbi:MAG TPA: DUF4190 domain-containing protein [Acidimicrobiales bacterium]
MTTEDHGGAVSSACPSCASHVEPGAAYCANCGSPLLVGSPAPSSSAPWPPPPPSALSYPPPPSSSPFAPPATHQAPYQAPNQPPHQAYYQPVYYQSAPPGPRSNGLAVASLVLGILWVWWLGSILALVFGYVALGQIKRSHEGGRGMAIAGVVLGWVGVGTGVAVGILLAVAVRHGNASVPLG